jgi:hypothetical protein
MYSKSMIRWNRNIKSLGISMHSKILIIWKRSMYSKECTNALFGSTDCATTESYTRESF